MFVFVVVILAGISVLLALYSVKKQKDLHELKKAKKELLKKKVLFQRESSV